MNRSRSYVGVVTMIYIAALIITSSAFLFLGFSESLPRFLISLIAVLAAESAVYGYAIYWLRIAGRSSGTPPMVISGAFIIAVYAAAVFAAVILLDRLLELPPLWYAAAQLLVLAAGAASIALTGLYGWNAGAQERQEKRSTERLLRHRKELAQIKLAARSWKYSGAGRLVELVHALEEKFIYSDPVSRSSLYAVEDMLSQQISLLHDQVELLLASDEPGVGWEAEMNDMAESIITTLQRRNRELADAK